MDWDQLLGPLGLTVGALILTGILGRIHLRDDARRDRALESLTSSVPELVASNKLMATVIETRLSEADAARPPPRRPRLAR